MISGSADNTAKLWDVSNGTCLKTWEFKTAVRRVQFSENDKKILLVTEPRMGFPATLQIFDAEDIDSEPGMILSRLAVATRLDSMAEKGRTIILITSLVFRESLVVFYPEGPKITVAAWGPLDKHIIAGRENGSVALLDPEVNTLACSRWSYYESQYQGRRVSQQKRMWPLMTCFLINLSSTPSIQHRTGSITCGDDLESLHVWTMHDHHQHYRLESTPPKTRFMSLP